MFQTLSIASLTLWSMPFVGLLLCIAILPLVPATSRWWDHNSSKLFVSLALAGLVCGYYLIRVHGFYTEPGLASLGALLRHSVIEDYLPFMVLLFSLFTISGGINLTGDVPARPRTNTGILFLGAILASLIGTTGASMVLIRPLLQINRERAHVKHTVVFFIFLVSNIGGSLLPLGDPPLFLGFLKGVPFLWTLRLWPIWLTCVGLLLAVYWLLDSWWYEKEDPVSLLFDTSNVEPFRLRGKINLLLLAGVVLGVAGLVPGLPIPGTSFQVPVHLREAVLLALAGLSMALTAKPVRDFNQFSFTPIGEVACLFIGIFITMQVPIELLHLLGPALGVTTPAHFFWAAGSLSSFLDNAPTYVVFFEAAKCLPVVPGQAVLTLADGQIQVRLLEAIAAGSVFMGANSYIGNGPNFLVKGIAEERGVRMPSFFGYMAYSCLILVPIFILVTLVFF
jgi:Na+/H+ antiporter NhaD/arsenite permease-like protein